jgi:hypothetical protein
MSINKNTEIHFDLKREDYTPEEDTARKYANIFIFSVESNNWKKFGHLIISDYSNKFLIPKPKNNNRKFKLVFYYSNYSDQEIEFHLEKNDNIKTINLGKIQLHKI